MRVVLTPNAESRASQPLPPKPPQPPQPVHVPPPVASIAQSSTSMEQSSSSSSAPISKAPALRPFEDPNIDGEWKFDPGWDGEDFYDVKNISRKFDRLLKVMFDKDLISAIELEKLSGEVDYI